MREWAPATVSRRLSEGRLGLLSELGLLPLIRALLAQTWGIQVGPSAADRRPLSKGWGKACAGHQGRLQRGPTGLCVCVATRMWVFTRLPGGDGGFSRPTGTQEIPGSSVIKVLPATPVCFDSLITYGSRSQSSQICGLFLALFWSLPGPLGLALAVAQEVSSSISQQTFLEDSVCWAQPLVPWTSSPLGGKHPGTKGSDLGIC